jgi:NADPH-dependent 2,4-dienoyl-CoA reductase/sulfur reductase-like enzyme
MLTIGDPCVAVEQPMMGPSRERSTVVVHLKSGATVRADRLLVATGRRPNVEAWRAAGLAQTERGWLKVDPATLEAQPGVFGAGDVTGLGGFTHLAYYHGQIVARRLRGMDARADHTAVPRVTFTDPEVASVGLSEAAAGRDRARLHPRLSQGRAQAGRRPRARRADRRDAGHAARGRDRRRARARDQAGHAAEDARRRHPSHFPAFNRMLGESLKSSPRKSRQRRTSMSSTQPGGHNEQHTDDQ